MAGLRAEVERSPDKVPVRIEAELLDLSRDGLRLRLTAPPGVEESITVRLRDKKSGVDLSLPCRVQWRRREEDDAWSVGCRCDRQLDWESLGTLFLDGFLSTDDPSS